MVAQLLLKKQNLGSPCDAHSYFPSIGVRTERRMAGCLLASGGKVSQQIAHHRDNRVNLLTRSHWCSVHKPFIQAKLRHCHADVLPVCDFHELHGLDDDYFGTPAKPSEPCKVLLCLPSAIALMTYDKRVPFRPGICLSRGLRNSEPTGSCTMLRTVMQPHETSLLSNCLLKAYRIACCPLRSS